MTGPFLQSDDAAGLDAFSAERLLSGVGDDAVRGAQPELSAILDALRQPASTAELAGCAEVLDAMAEVLSAKPNVVSSHPTKKAGSNMLGKLITAKAVASLDFMSGGRFIFGVGGGWNAEAMENHGTSFGDRYEVLRQRVLAMKQIWGNEAAEFHGSVVDFDPIWSRPKPVQQPHPPILLAGESAKVRQRVVDYCDGWLPRAKASPDIPAGIADLRARAEASGRDPRSISVTVFGARGDAAVLDSYRAAGADRVVLGLPAAPREIVLPLLDQHARLLSV